MIYPEHLKKSESLPKQKPLEEYPQSELITPEEREKAFSNASRDVLKLVGKHLDPKKLQAIYPGLNLDELDKYDLSQSDVELYILGQQDFVQAYGREDEILSGFKIVLNKEGPHPRRIIVVRATESRLSREFDHYPELEYTLRHEILHHLDVGAGFKKEFLREGLIEYLTFLSSPVLSGRISRDQVDVSERNENINEFLLQEYGDKVKVFTLEEILLGYKTDSPDLSNLRVSGKSLSMILEKDYFLSALVFSTIQRVGIEREGWEPEDFVRLFTVFDTQCKLVIYKLLAKYPRLLTYEFFASVNEISKSLLRAKMKLPDEIDSK